MELALLFAIGLGLALAGKGGSKKAKIEDKKTEGKKTVPAPTPDDQKPKGNPPGVPKTFNHKDWPSVRLQYTLLGYANNQFSTTRPTGGFVGQFQRDYNSVSAACLNDAIFATKGGGPAVNVCELGEVGRMGKLAVDKKTGQFSAMGLEVAKRVQARTGKTWTRLVQMAHQAGF